MAMYSTVPVVLPSQRKVKAPVEQLYNGSISRNTPSPVIAVVAEGGVVVVGAGVVTVAEVGGVSGTKVAQ